MNSELSKLLDKYHLKLFYRSLDKKGYLVKTPSGFKDIIVVKDGLSDEETEKVILHEIGHAKNDKNAIGNYKHSYSTRICSECGANDFMVSEKVRQYIALGNDASSANWLDLAKSIGTDNYLQVREELRKYSTE